MNQQQDDLLAFLVGNMKDMEIELRAHSIVFEALKQKVVGIEDVDNALTMARNSTDMLRFIEEKYRLLGRPGRSAANQKLGFGTQKISILMH